MCRHLAYLGEPRTLASLILEPSAGLLVQSYRPRRQNNGLMNADGWGVGYFPAGGAAARWRSARPIWGDANLASVAPTISSTSVIAAVRSATAGMPIDETATAPFACGDRLFSHNGRVDRSVFPAEAAARAESVCDAAVFAAYCAMQGFDRLAETVVEIGTKDPAARLNALAVSRDRILATTWGDTLSYLALDRGVVVASEPYDDDPCWVDVADRTFLTVNPDLTITLERLQ